MIVVQQTGQQIKKTFSPEEKYGICKECKWFRAYIKQCKKCLCFMPLKVKLPKENCPLGKW